VILSPPANGGLTRSERRSSNHTLEWGTLVPVGYAEKSMASLMQLHSELMEEKERRVDLYQRLMDKEQVLAELRMYVKLLEEKLALTADAEPKIQSGPDPHLAPAPRRMNRPPPPPRPPNPERPRIAVRLRPLGQQTERDGATQPAARAPGDASIRRVPQPSDPSSRTASDGWRTW
jgi:hypothetical protein